MKYKIMLRGENFKVAMEKSVAKMGFFTTRFVEAETPEAAERAAVDLVRQDVHLHHVVRNVPADPPMIYLEDLAEIPSFDGSPVPGAGYSWFPGEVDGGSAQEPV